MRSKNRYNREENPFNNPFENPGQYQPVKKEMSGCRLIVLIALGILLASFVGCVASVTFTGAMLKGVMDALNPNNPNYEKLVKSTAKDLEPLVKKNLQQVIPNKNDAEQNSIPILPIVPILPALPYRSEIVRQNSERAVMQARKETQSFDSIYKKPAECYDIKDSETRIKCANNYMSARKAFNENKMVRINNEDETISPQTKEACYEKSTGRKVSCGNDYIREKAAFAASNR